MNNRERIAAALSEYPPSGSKPYSRLNWYDDPMAPRDRNLLGTGVATGGAAALGATLAGAPGIGTAATGLVGAGIGMGGEYLADEMVRQPARDAYNNEFGPNNEMPAGYDQNGPVWPELEDWEPEIPRERRVRY